MPEIRTIYELPENAFLLATTLEDVDNHSPTIYDPSTDKHYFPRYNDFNDWIKEHKIDCDFVLYKGVVCADRALTSRTVSGVKTFRVRAVGPLEVPNDLIPSNTDRVNIFIRYSNDDVYYGPGRLPVAAVIFHSDRDAMHYKLRWS